MSNPQVTTLANGLRVITEPMVGVRSVALGIWVGTGSRYETDAEAGIERRKKLEPDAQGSVDGCPERAVAALELIPRSDPELRHRRHQGVNRDQGLLQHAMNFSSVRNAARSHEVTDHHAW